MFANTQGGGQDMAAPDVCLTPAPPGPPVPTPYPNTAQGNMGSPPVNNVLISSAPAHNTSTMVSLTNGDNGGVATGTMSGTVMGPSRHTNGASTVLIGGMPATRLSSSSMQNSTNAHGARIAPSQTKLLILAS